MRCAHAVLLSISFLVWMPASRAADEWAEGVPYYTDWDKAIDEVRQTGKILVIYSGYQQPSTCMGCDAMRAALTMFAEGSNRRYAKYRRVFQDKFVFLAEFTKSVQEENMKRGPEGPYQIKNSSVPVLVFKKWTGEDVALKNGFPTDEKTGPALLAELIDRALKGNGAIERPKKKDLEDNPIDGKTEEDKEKEKEKEKDKDKDEKDEERKPWEDDDGKDLVRPPVREGEPDIPVPEPEDLKMRWVGSLEKAKCEAALRNVPIFLLLGEDTNAAFDLMLATIFLQQSFASKVVDKAVPVVAFKGHNHDSEEEEIDGVKLEICEIFKFPCAEHIDSYDAVLKTLIHRSYWAPLVMILRPDGSEILRLEGKDHKLDRYIEELDYAISFVGDGMDDRAYRKLIDLMDRSRRYREKGKIQSALRELTKLAENRAATPAFVALASKEKETIDAIGLEEVDAAVRLAETGDTTKALSTLRTIAREYDGVRAGERANEELARLQGE